MFIDLSLNNVPHVNNPMDLDMGKTEAKC